MGPQIEKILDGFSLPEGPFWDVENQVLYFVDIFSKTIHRYDPVTEEHTKALVESDNNVNFIIPLEDRKDHFVIGTGPNIAIVFWDGKNDKVPILQILDSADDTQMFNDGKCDSTGRLWSGTIVFDPAKGMNEIEPLGSLYSLESNRKLQPRLGQIRISNGLDWDDITKKMYYIDTLKATVDRYDFDPVTGDLSNGQIWFSLKDHNIKGMPDGMTVDSEGNLWVAAFGSSQVLKIDGKETGKLLRSVEMPLNEVTSVAFGGKNLDELYVTLADIERYRDSSGKLRQPSSLETLKGAVYKVTDMEATGKPACKFISKK